MKSIFILYIVLMLFFSCKSTNNSYELVRKNLTQYFVNNNEAKLKKSYRLLIKNSDFKENGLNKKNIDVVFPILIKMKKYDQLLNLIESSNNVLSPYHKNFHANYIQALKYKCINIKEFNFYINKNLDLIKNEIDKNPKDSIKLFDYLTFKASFVGKKNAIDDLNLFKETNKFSDFFYKNIVLKTIEEIDTTMFNCK